MSPEVHAMPMRCLLPFLSFLLVLGVGWPSAASATESGTRPDRLLAEQGAVLFRRHCAVCHGLDARGDGPAAGALLQVPADLTRIAARREGRFDAAQVARIIDGRFEIEAHGTREMPIWGARLGDDIPDRDLAEEFVRGRIDLLVEYLRDVQEAVEPGAASP
jgi:mono/diheme cytochrome c family protein